MRRPRPSSKSRRPGHTTSVCICSTAASMPCGSDDFRIEEVVDKNMDATAVRNINNYPTSGDKLTTSVTYTNRGKEGCDNFKVQLIDDDGTVLGEKSVTGKLAAGKSGTAEISWTVPSVTGRFAIRGRVIMAGDKVENDNISAPCTSRSRRKGNVPSQSVPGSKLSARFPFDYYSYNFSQNHLSRRRPRFLPPATSPAYPSRYRAEWTEHSPKSLSGFL